MKQPIITLSGLALLSLFSVAQASNIELFSETFDGITTGYSSGQQFGVPNNTGGNTTLDGGADENWYGARFEQPGGGTIAQDVGVQKVGGGIPNNPTPTGLAEDDAGLMFRLDTTGLENIQLIFDWRTFSTGTTDRFIAGYFVGDLLAGHPNGIATDNTVDLRNAAHGGTDGAWNWNPINSGNTGNWNELMRATSPSNWQAESFNLNLADDASEVWVAFWLDNGENDFSKFDNVVVTADAIIPLPAAAWLFGSGLLGLIGLARRKTA